MFEIKLPNVFMKEIKKTEIEMYIYTGAIKIYFVEFEPKLSKFSSSWKYVNKAFTGLYKLVDYV